jgi:beta-lactamase regulating signal transducer with metallopeptidase domain
MLGGLFQALGWALVHSLWQGCLVGGAAALLMAVSGKGNARAHHAIAFAGLLACVVLPALTFFHGVQAATAPGLQETVVPTVLAAADPGLRPAAPDLPLAFRFTAFLSRHLAWITGAWALGAAFMALRLGRSWLGMLHLRRETAPAPGPWVLRFQGLARELGAGAGVVLRVSTRVATPVALGLWRPVVLVPAALFTLMPEPYLEALLAHELAHVARYDFLLNLLQSVIEVLCFHHPVVWWLSRRVRTARELLCDDRAAKVIGEPRRLALALNALDDVQPHLTHLALAARGGPLYERIHRLLTPASLPGAGPWALAPILALAIPLAAVSLKAGVQEAPPIAVNAAQVAELDALAAREGLDPQLLRTVAWVESNFNSWAKSPQGAQGLLQVMPETALKYGAKDLSDAKEVAAAGAHYLKFLMDRYQGDVAKAVAAYNCGHEAFDAGKIGPETVNYRALVLDVLKAKAVQPEAALANGAVRGTFRLRGDGKTWSLMAAYKSFGNTKLEVLEEGAPEGQARRFGSLVMGDTDPGAHKWSDSHPIITMPIPSGTAVRVRCVDSTLGILGEARLVLDAPWKTFAFTMEGARK